MTETYQQTNLAGSLPETIFNQIQDEQAAQREGRLDFSQFRNDSGESWEDVWDEDLSLVENIKNIIHESVILPSASVQVPVAIAYILIPSAMATCVPNLFCTGQKGTGKSSIGYIAAGIHYGKIPGYVLGSGSTFASTRNYIQKIRFHEGSANWERNCCLIWDDLKASTLNDEKLYAMIRSGYNRASDLVTISGSEPGQNLEFHTFCPKIISSIEPFYAQHKFSELSRRVIVLKFKKYEHFSPEEKREAELDQSFDIKDRFVPETADWTGLESKFDEFWKNTDHLMQFQQLKKAMTKRGKKCFTIPDSIEGENWTVSIDLIATGVVTGVWDSLQSAVDHMGIYWQWFRDNVQSSLGSTQKVLRAYIEQSTAVVRLANEKLGYEAVPVRVDPKLIKDHLVEAANKGWLDTSIRAQDVASVMADLGWKQELVDGSIYWVPMNG